ncbi:MAG: 6-bladed beta-propeller [Planctomycetes bacterium]|nr:6-bladed beta-propeller [Planctomycetota bacterium]
MNIDKQYFKIGCHGSVMCFLLLFCVSCAVEQREMFPALEQPVVWPEPPDQERIRYVGMISTEEDLKRGVSWIQSLGELIFGREEIGVLLAPSAVVLGANEKLYISDGAGGVVHVFDLATRGYKQFSALGNDEKLTMPVALTIINGRLYVVDSVLHKVCIFDRKGKYLGSFGSELLIRPSGIAYFAEQDKLYISDTGGHVIRVFDKSGEFIETIGSRGIEPGQFNFPTHLCMDNNGKLYVSDTLNYRVQIFSHEGKFLKMFGEQGDRPGQFAHPAGIATDSFGHIYVADRQYENIQIFNSDGEILMAIGYEGSGIGEFWLPAGMYIDERNRIYVADSFNKRVQVFELIGGAE